MKIIPVNEEQRETLVLLDELIAQEKTHDEIMDILHDKGYDFRKEIKNGYMSKTKTELLKNGNYSFVDLIKRRNGLAWYEFTRIS